MPTPGRPLRAAPLAVPLVGRSRVLPRGLAGLLLVALALAGCSDDGAEPAAAPVETRTPLASFDTTGLVVARDGFCTDVAPADVAHALGAEVASSRSYDNGEAVRLVDGVRDVAHEYGCDWVATDRSVARAWVFAPPVTRARAGVLAAQARTARGCAVEANTPRFGARSVALTCRDGRRLTASYRGLFGDAWLTCSLEARAARTGRGDLLARAGDWCVTVATAARVG